MDWWYAVYFLWSEFVLCSGGCVVVFVFICCGVCLYSVVVGVWWYLCLFLVECVCSVVNLLWSVLVV